MEYIILSYPILTLFKDIPKLNMAK